MSADLVRQRHRVGQLVRVAHNDGAERRGGGADEENRKGGGAAVLSRAGEKSVPPLHSEFGHRVRRKQRTIRQMFSGVFFVYFRTLYCSKGNYEFGISRVIKSLEPYNKKLGMDTW